MWLATSAHSTGQAKVVYWSKMVLTPRFAIGANPGPQGSVSTRSSRR